jgi:hypothetical protein
LFPVKKQSKNFNNYKEKTMLEINDKDIANLQQYAELGLDDQLQQQRYPAIQLNQYIGLQPKSDLFWVMTKDSVDLVSEADQAVLKLSPIEIYYGEDAETMFRIGAKIKFIPLFIPKVFKWNKLTGEISQNGKFVEGDRTIAKLFCLVLAEGNLTNTIVTLKLKSFRTEEVIGGKKPTEGTLRSLSNELYKRGIGVRGKSNIHFVNIAINPTVKTYQSRNNESSRGVSYQLDKASLNTPQNMVFISELLGDPELQKDILDPFGLDEEKPITNTNVLSDEELADISF